MKDDSKKNLITIRKFISLTEAVMPYPDLAETLKGW